MTVTEILPGRLWLGSAPCTAGGGANDDTLSALREAGVTHVVNCTPDFPFPSAAQLAVGGAAAEQHRVPVPDVDDAPIQAHFDAAADFIDAAVRGGGVVFVHCETGKSRSATIVLAYRVKHGADTLRAAWDDTKARRPYAEPKPAFMQRLVAAFPGAAGGFNHREYSAAYLVDHFAAFGLERADVDAALARADGEYDAAFAALGVAAQEKFF